MVVLCVSLSATARAGLQADKFAATIVVNSLARAQSSYSGVVADKTAAIGTGTMTIITANERSRLVSLRQNGLKGWHRAGTPEKDPAFILDGASLKKARTACRKTPRHAGCTVCNRPSGY